MRFRKRDAAGVELLPAERRMAVDIDKYRHQFRITFTLNGVTHCLVGIINPPGIMDEHPDFPYEIIDSKDNPPKNRGKPKLSKDGTPIRIIRPEPKGE